MNAPRTIFIETQRYSALFHILVSLFLTGCLVFLLIYLRMDIKLRMLSKGTIFGGLGLILAFIIVFSMNVMRTQVTEKNILITFGELKILRKSIPIPDIKEFDIITFKPLKEYWGYGIRRSRDGTWCYTFRGNDGIRIELSNGKKYLIGTEKPKELYQALSNAISERDKTR